MSDGSTIRETPLINKIDDPNGPKDENRSLETDLILFKTDWASGLTKNLKDESVELRIRQEKIAKAHGVLREIGNLKDEKNGLDLKQNPELKKKLKEIRDELGVEILADLDKFSPHQTNTLVDNINSAVEDWDMLNQSQLRKITSLHAEVLQAITYVKQLIATIKRAKDASCQAIKN